MEEFFRAQRYPPFMETILEDPSSPQYSEKPMPFVPCGTLGLPTVDGVAGSARNSLDVGSRRSGESIYSAVSSSGNPPPSISPTTSLSHLRGMSTRCQRLNPGSEDGHSARQSLSEGSDDEIKDRPRSTASKEPSEDDDGPSPSTLSLDIALYQESSRIPERSLLASSQPEWKLRFPNQDLNILLHLRNRLGSNRVGEGQAKVHQEYELKLRLLDDLNSQNTRVRQTLNRVANTIREQDALHASFTAMLDVPHVGLPQDAVEDIHLRVLRQRDVLRRFIYSAKEKTPGPMKSVLDHPIASLTRALENITVQHEEITVKAQEVVKVLQSVKALHADVKAEYNETLAQTSVVYPELSYIVALEESYKDQYQQVWEFGMDALTFLLDNVTPFWRTYGKTLGVDIQDFLIIPLYRNEFTGEAKRYPIKHIPRRSFRHWLGFLIFFVLTSAICFLQCRAAITSSRNYRLQIIAHSGFRWLLVPFVWVSIVIQWSAFLVELCMLIVQVAVTAWWLGWILRIFD
ncbi:membrane protein [Salix suchowensis]|nr:membrane protein [Salix suchowensis]